MSFRILVMIFGLVLVGPMCNPVHAVGGAENFVLCYRRAAVTALAEAGGVDLSAAEIYLSDSPEGREFYRIIAEYAAMHFVLIWVGDYQEAIQIVRNDFQPDYPLIAEGMINCIRELR